MVSAVPRRIAVLRLFALAVHVNRGYRPVQTRAVRVRLIPSVALRISVWADFARLARRVAWQVNLARQIRSVVAGLSVSVECARRYHRRVSVESSWERWAS